MSNETVRIPTEAIEKVSISKGSKSALASLTEKGGGVPSLTVKDVEEGFVTLQKAQELLGIAHLAYARRLVKENKLEGIRVAVPGGSRWLVTTDSIDRYSVKRIRSRELRNYILRIPMEQEDTVRKLLEKADIPYTLEMAYVKKEKQTKKGETLWASLVARLEK